MHSRATRLSVLGPAGLLLLTALATGCASTSPGQVHVVAPTPSRTTGRTVFFPQYGVDSHAYRPGRLNASVDGSFYVARVRWTTWDDREAVGDGVAHVNDCRPTCADGHYATYRVTVHLGQPRALCGSRFFTTIRVRGSGYHTYGHRTGVGCG
jgi:hypothetical protein